jgi:cytochrome b6-f complex iron-sulfur subunit
MSEIENAKSTPSVPQEGETRRSFLNRLWLALGLVALGELVAVVVAFLWPRRRAAELQGAAAVIEAGAVDSFALNSVTAFVRGKFYLCRLADGGFLAVSRKCTHLGCTLPWVEEEQRFVCPCHASAFDMRGEVVSPPAPRALDLFKITIENDIVKVDTRTPLKRSSFREEQVLYA